MDRVIPSPKDGYYLHTGTDSHTFIQTALELRDRGVENYGFMLALYDPGLADLTLHDPAVRLTREEKTRVLIELTSNPWYFWRELLLVPVPGGKERFKLHLGNCAILWAMSCNINIYTILPRQNYKTFSILSFYLWAYCFASRNTNIMLLNKHQDDSKNNLKRLKEMMELFPKWVTNEVLTSKGDLDQQEAIYSKSRNNRIDAKPSATNIQLADKLGRGATSPLRYFDELAFIPYIKEIWSSATPAGNSADESARKNNTPYGTAISTTPNILSDPSGEFAHFLMNGSCPFQERFYDFGEEGTREYMKEATFDFLFSQYHWYELRRDEAWLEEQRRSLLYDQLAIKKNITLEWPLSSDTSIFTEEEMDNLTSYRKEASHIIPIKSDRTDLPSTMELCLTDIIDRSIPFAIGIDPSSMIGQDYLAFVVTDPGSEIAVGHLRTNRANDTQAKEVLRILMEEIFPNAIAVVETNHHLGTALINYALTTSMRGRLFYRMKKKVPEQKIVEGNAPPPRKEKVKVFGYTMTSTSREAAFQYLSTIIRDTPHKLAPTLLQSEIESLHRTRTGKIEARPNAHDDILMAYLLTVLATRDPDKTFWRIYHQRRSKMSRDLERVAMTPTPQIPEGVSEIQVNTVTRHATETISQDDYIARQIKREMKGKKSSELIRQIMRMND